MTTSLDALIPRGGGKNLSFRWGVVRAWDNGQFVVEFFREGGDTDNVPVEDTLTPLVDGAGVLCMFWGTKMFVLGQRAGGSKSSIPFLDIPVGTIVAWAGGKQSGIPDQRAPNGKKVWLLCDGHEVHGDDYPELYKMLGTVYGTAKVQGKWFKVPDLRGRVPFGADPTGVRSQIYRQPGVVMGSETQKLTVDNLPPHTHPQNVSVDFGSGPAKRRDYVVDVPAGKGQVFEQGIGTGSTGKGEPVWILPPSLAVAGWYIKASKLQDG